MALDRIFYLYIGLVGIAAGALLTYMPAAGDFALKPYFWILIAVGLFDVGAYLRGRGAPGTMLPMPARLVGFGLGLAFMIGVTMMSGAPVKFL